jgi:hypothetical protein
VALLIKNLHKFFNNMDIPWVNLVWEKYYSNGKLPSHIKKGSFWWRNILKLLDQFKGMAPISVQSGPTCLFWDDLWFGQVPRLAFPELYSFTKKPNLTLAGAKSQNFIENFNLPLSEEAFDQFILLEGAVQNFQPSEAKDVWSYIWGRREYFSAKAYKHLTGSSGAHPIFSWVWKSSCQHKHEVFFWLLAHDRLSTRNILRKHALRILQLCLISYVKI